MKKAIIVLVSFILTFTIMTLNIMAIDDKKEDWEIYESYLYYNNDGTKTSGYTIDKIKFQLTSEFLDDHFLEVIDASYFPEIADRIVKLEFIEFYEYNIIFREPDPEFSEKKPVYTEEEIDEYIGFLKYVKDLDFVLVIMPEKTTIEPFDPVEDWEKYENYIDYKNDGTKGHGYSINYINVDISSEYLSENEVTPSTFPEIKDRIVRIMPPDQYSSSQNRYRIDFVVNDPYVAHDPAVYTEEEIDEFIAAAKYLNSLDFVISAKPDEVVRVTLDDPEPNETESTAGGQTTEQAPAESADTSEQTDVPKKAEESDVPEADKANNNTKNSAQTGDPLVTYMIIAILTVICGSALIIYAKKKAWR